MEELRDLEKQRNKKIFWTVLWFCIWWPIGIYNLIKLISILRDIKDCKSRLQ